MRALVNNPSAAAAVASAASAAAAAAEAAEAAVTRNVYPSDVVFALSMHQSGFNEMDLPDVSLIIFRALANNLLLMHSAALSRHRQFSDRFKLSPILTIAKTPSESDMAIISKSASLGVSVIILAGPDANLGLISRSADCEVKLQVLNWQSCMNVADILTGDNVGKIAPCYQPAKPNNLSCWTHEAWNLSFRMGMKSSEDLLRRMGMVSGFPPVPAPRLTLADCPGLGAAEVWGRQLVEDLSDFKAGRLKWQDIDAGVLLVGPPGTGKTRFAQALAGTADVNVVLTSPAQWISSKEGHLGTYVQAMRAVFDEARACAPSILFIDELDAVGSRDNHKGGNETWNTGTVTALLECMDGAAGREGVVVVAATNNERSIDPALRRSGRLDRTVQVELPDAQALQDIFRVHLVADLMGADLGPIVNDQAIGGTGADVARWCREARRLARKARRDMSLDDLRAVVRLDGKDAKVTMGFSL